MQVQCSLKGTNIADSTTFGYHRRAKIIQISHKIYLYNYEDMVGFCDDIFCYMTGENPVS